MDPAENIAYIRVKELVENTAEQVEMTLRQLGDVRGLILDLRDNPGGLLPSAVTVSNLFLRQGVIVSCVDRTAKRQTYEASNEGMYSRVPMCVLVNGQTASAAEIVAGALAMHGRAALVGTRTRGKGCVQTPLALPGNMGQVNLTTAEYFLADDTPIARRAGSDRWGIEPHERVSLRPSEEKMLRRLYREAEVVSRRRQTTTETSRPVRQEISFLDLLKADAQLARAMELLSIPDAHDAAIQRAAAQRRAAAKERAKSGPASQASETRHE